jgi:hypothetical protein
MDVDCCVGLVRTKLYEVTYLEFVKVIKTVFSADHSQKRDKIKNCYRAHRGTNLTSLVTGSLIYTPSLDELCRS